MVDVYELRRILECEAAALAAERHGDAHLRLMDAAIEEMAKGAREHRPERAELYIDGDLRFHLAIAEATRNGVILHTMRALRELIRRALMSIFVVPREPRALVGAAPRHPRRDRRARRRPGARRDARRTSRRVESDIHRALAAGVDAWLSSATSASA